VNNQNDKDGRNDDSTSSSGVYLAGMESAWPRMVESLTNGVLLLDARGNILYTNREAQRLLQRRARELHGRPFGYPLKHGEPVEFDLIGVDGRHRVIEIRAVPVGFSDGDGWVASLHDVTERSKERDAKLRQGNLGDDAQAEPGQEPAQ
jgi:PAS domain-containing protein